MAPFVPDTLSLGSVRLRVRDLDRSLAFYTGILGLWLSDREGETVLLGTPGEDTAPLLILEEDRAAPPRPAQTTGLYHFALLFPDRPSLARTVLRLRALDWPFEGFSDHIVSEAVYLSDPEGNGIELYRDRPRSEWRWQGGSIVMATLPLDLKGLLSEAEQGPEQDAGAFGVVLGHIHLQVADLGRAEAFYHGQLGLAVTTRSYGGALFFSAGGYHHHIGVNIWAGRGLPPPPAGAAGLVDFSFQLPPADLEVWRRHLEEAGVGLTSLATGGFCLRDPDGIVIRTEPRTTLPL